MSYVWLCHHCDGTAQWNLFRNGDAVVSWACDDHLVEEANRLQRDHERTKLIVTVNTRHPVLPSMQDTEA